MLTPRSGQRNGTTAPPPKGPAIVMGAGVNIPCLTWARLVARQQALAISSAHFPLVPGLLLS